MVSWPLTPWVSVLVSPFARVGSSFLTVLKSTSLVSVRVRFTGFTPCRTTRATGWVVTASPITLRVPGISTPSLSAYHSSVMVRTPGVPSVSVWVWPRSNWSLSLLTISKATVSVRTFSWRVRSGTTGSSLVPTSMISSTAALMISVFFTCLSVWTPSVRVMV